MVVAATKVRANIRAEVRMDFFIGQAPYGRKCASLSLVPPTAFRILLAQGNLLASEKKGIREYRREAYRGRIESIVSTVQHPVVSTLVWGQILVGANTAAEVIALLDGAVTVRRAGRDKDVQQ
jgi:hypothetical protein